MKKGYLISIVILFIMSLSGCVQNTSQYQSTQKYGYGELCSTQKTCGIMSNLRSSGAIIEKLGDQIVITAASKDLFNTSNWRSIEPSNSILDQTAQLLRCYQKIKVEVAVYANQFKEANKNRILADQQGQAVVKYLWSKNINARLVYYDEMKGRTPSMGNSVEIGTKLVP